ncbi:MAG: hypothetical protein HN846_01910 [Candidatus Pacebacteria bacterium]|jgi:dCMP deaminase|nr:hypothetical protein [Candidatus Paceibacterota bacterium]MBT3512018.1 hypothetical protein [Candidatus Paceibacterota bacterium]MBT4004870.1 hypothetical protein [Candidatus Paceibacterota bacterium]MBT4359049.1 hypothetical protein [Candidatus Paceibacterota bacterium]MBT4680536.1 hypothetical protein [Candidatus Paceibacterota bacterium]
MATNKTAIVTYVPVIHAGYINLFEKYPEADLVIVDKEILDEQFRSIQKDIRALETKQIIDSLQTLFPERQIIHLQFKKDLDEYQQIIMPEDEISDWLQAEFFPGQDIKYDSIFLRWSGSKTKQKQDVSPDEEVTVDELHQRLMGGAVKEAGKSADWWRQTAAAVAKDGELISIAHNKHAPSDQIQYINGDPRVNFSRGEAMEVSSSLHAEEAVIAKAAAEGISLKGADLYATTFPCPFCARLVAYSGIKRVFYKDGYSVLDGAELMKSQGVELVKVKL